MTPPSVVTLRPVGVADCIALWRWRNDPDTRRASLDQAEIPLDEHTRWFEASLVREDRRMYIILADSVDAGMVRLDVGGREATVSVNIAAEWRGLGVGIRA